MVETLCDSDSVKLKAGANVSTDLSAANFTELINQAESFICADTRYNWVDNYANLDADTKKILEDAAASYAAIDAIKYDTSSYNSIREAELLMDACYTKFKETIKLLGDKVHTDWLKQQTV